MVNKQKEFIAFEGKKFTIEWYFNHKGESIALDYLESLDTEDQVKLFELMKLMGDVGVIKNKAKFRNEGNKIYAFKPQPHRFLCFFFKEQKIKERAVNKNDYEDRVQRGSYYA